MYPVKHVPNPIEATPVPGAWMGRTARSQSEPRSYWAFAHGCAHYAFFVKDDRTVERQNQQVARMLAQTNRQRERDAQTLKQCFSWGPSSDQPRWPDNRNVVYKTDLPVQVSSVPLRSPKVLSPLAAEGDLSMRRMRVSNEPFSVRQPAFPGPSEGASSPSGRNTSSLAKSPEPLCRYEINGAVLASRTKPVPPPEQDKNSGHWVTEVNANTGEFNPMTNLNLDRHLQQYRDMQKRQFRAGSSATGMPAAGQVQRKPVITCHDIQSFVPVRKEERMKNYHLIQRNL
ncbi:unnamed protein product [Amoebophrya sp. A120]|nr:unnamed protein product [Amoebophrya sp. A120]|eukprot:GSA120T00002433001.1